MSIVSDLEARSYVGVDSDDTLLPVIRPLVEKAVRNFVGWDLEQAEYTRYYPKTEKGGADDVFVGGFGVVSGTGGRTQKLQLDHKYALLADLEVREHSGANFGQTHVFDDDDLLTLGTQYILVCDDGVVSKTGHVTRLAAYWPKGAGSVQVVYTAGFTPEEFEGRSGSTDASEIRYAVLDELQRAYQEARNYQQSSSRATVGGPIMSESVPGYSYTLALLPSAATALFGRIRPLSLQTMHRLQKFRRWGLAI